MSKVWINRIMLVVALIIFGAAIYILSKTLHNFRYDEVKRQLAEIPPLNVVLSLISTVLAYSILTVYDATAFQYIGRPMKYLRVALVSFVGYSFSHTLGFGAVTGGSLRFRMYSHWGVGPLDIAKVVLFGGTAYFLGIVAVAGVVLLVQADQMSEVTPVSAHAIRLIGMVSLVIGCGYLLWSWRGKPAVRLGGALFPPPKLRLAVTQLGTAVLEWGFASAVLFCLLPPEIGVGYLAFLAIYVIAQVAGMISHVPGGLGVFETLILVLLPEDAPKEGVLAALIIYRVIYFILPLIVAATMFAIYELSQHRGRLGRLFGRKEEPPADA